MESFSICAFVVDLYTNSILPKRIEVEAGKITTSTDCDESLCKTYLLPGFIDAHVHIESSLLIPSEFARMAVIHGSVGTISDPHEIANVLGIDGVNYMLDNASQVPFHFFFGAPSCVPATQFETAGATLDANAVEKLLAKDNIWYLAEMMNYPGVLHREPLVMDKIMAAQKAAKPIDGHAPGLRGEEVKRYASAGISTDHECFTLEEGLDKIAAGMIVQIREGSAARNFEALHPLLGLHPNKVMFCSDDKHPDSLLEGHINNLVKRALALGYNFFDVLKAASLHVKNHYRLPVGMLQVGDWADFIEIDSPESFNVLTTWIRGRKVAENGKSLLNSIPANCPNQFVSRTIHPADLVIRAEKHAELRVIEAYEGQLVTGVFPFVHGINEGDNIPAFPADDVLKIAVVNRYADAKPAVAFIRNMGLKCGAIASTVAHDSHNIVACGCSEEEIAKAINLLMDNKGGLAAVGDEHSMVLPLPVAGLMSNRDAWEIADAYIELDNFVKTTLKSPLRAPFMTLSFMALLVIPEIKLSDKGLFDGSQFKFCSPFISQ